MGLSDAEYLKKIRKELGITQSEMAEKMGYTSYDSVTKIETGRRELGGPAKKCLEYIAELEGIDL